uniref:Hexosyltransferase n=1 Tax=Romanomermis culicivorax TaxID=13658 RepID=A0A915JL74_ROMCU
MQYKKRLEDFHKFLTVVLLTAALYCIWALPKLDKGRVLAEQLKPDEKEIQEMIGSEEHLAQNSSHTFESCLKDIQEKETPVRNFLIRPKECDNQTLVIMVKSSLVRAKIGVGRSKKYHFKDRTIIYENKRYGDILKVDLIDGYSMKNLIDKSLSLLRFGAQHCPGAKFFLIADDDTMLAPLLLPTILPQEI